MALVTVKSNPIVDIPSVGISMDAIGTRNQVNAQLAFVNVYNELDLLNSEVVKTSGNYTIAGNINFAGSNRFNGVDIFDDSRNARLSVISDSEFWTLTNATGTNNLLFSRTSNPSGALTGLYSLSSTGTPTLSTDLITKTYFDSNNNGGAGGGANELSDLTDVGTVSPTLGNVIVGDGSNFISRAIIAEEIDYSPLDILPSNNLTVQDAVQRLEYLSSELRISGDSSGVDGRWLISGQDSSDKDNVYSKFRFDAIQPFTGNQDPEGFDFRYLDTNNVLLSTLLSVDVDGSVYAPSLTISKINQTGAKSLINKEALDDAIAGVTAGGITLDNQNKIDNSRKFNIVNPIGDYITNQESIEVTSGSDIGKKTITATNASITAEGTFSNIGNIGDTKLFDKYSSTSDHKVVPSTGVSFIWDDLTDTNQGANILGLTSFTKISSDTWKGSGNYSTYNLAIIAGNLYTDSTAINPDNESNVVITQTSDGVTVTAINTLTTDGSFSYRVEKTSIAGDSNNRSMSVRINGLIFGHQYRVEVDLRKTPGTTFNVATFNNWDYQVENVVGDDVWETKTLTTTAQDNSGTGDIFFSFATSNVAGSIGYIDKLIITDITP